MAPDPKVERFSCRKMKTNPKGVSSRKMAPNPNYMTKKSAIDLDFKLKHEKGLRIGNTLAQTNDFSLDKLKNSNLQYYFVVPH